MKTVVFETLAELDYKTTEAYRTLRTNLRFTGDDVKVVMFTSAMPGEGKSTVVFNLARSLSKSGFKTLIIDSDMRKSVMVGRYRAVDSEGESIKGLSHLLSGQAKIDDVLYFSEQLPTTCMIFSGSSVLNATELLEKDYFNKLIEWARGCFDYVLIDCAPLGLVIDAAVIAPLCDGAVIVTAQKDVSSRMVLSVKRQLETTGVKILGAVLNKIRMNGSGRYGRYYSGYYNKYYDDGEHHHEGKKKGLAGKLIKKKNELISGRKGSSKK